MQIQVKFDNPGSVSLSDQSNPDDLIVVFPTEFELFDSAGYPLILEGEQTDTSTNFYMPC